MEKKKNFRLIDCVLAVVCVILTVEAAAPAASIGNSQFFWWLFLLVCFCLPYALISAELGTTYEGEGGICDWVSRAFGRKWGTRVAWYYWINFPLWMASVSVLVTDNLPFVIGRELNGFAVVLFRLCFIWGVALLSLCSLSGSKWLFNISTAFKAIILGGLGVAGIYVAITRGVANPVTLKSLMPGADLRSLSFVSVIIFNFMGFEVVTTYVGDMPSPKRDIPRAILWGGLVVTALYVLASFGIGAAIPVKEISTSMGIMDAMSLMLGTLSPFIVVAVGIMLLISMFSNQLSWAVGINFVARYCSQSGGGMPKIFRLSTKNGAPLGAALMDGILATILVLIAPLLPSEGLFWSFFALNLVMLLMSYVPLFPAFLKLRKMDADIERPYKVPGSPKLLKVASYLALFLICSALVFTVVPLNSGELEDKIPLVLGSIFGLVSGEIVASRIKNKNKNSNV
ncbi:MAG: APC family permease [Treponema sp.]|nr:APC family permease [Treponema sp.]